MRVSQAKHAKRAAMHMSCRPHGCSSRIESTTHSLFFEAVSHDYPPRAWVHSGTPPSQNRWSSNVNGAATVSCPRQVLRQYSPRARAGASRCVGATASLACGPEQFAMDRLRGFVTPPSRSPFWCNLGIGTTPSWLKPASVQGPEMHI